MRKYLLPILAASVLALTAPHADAAERKLTPVTKDVWRFDNNFHVSMVVVTPEGVVVGDPINAPAASWLKAEIAKRFAKPVKYLIMSHSHADHASGGEVFEDTATVVTHENFKKAIAAGRVTTAQPDVTFKDTHSFRFGGKTFELTYLGPGHGEDMIVTIVRPDNVAFVVDVVSPRRLQYRDIPVRSLDEFMAQIRKVEGLDFDILLPGHSVTGTRQDVTDIRIYLERLRDRVKTAMDAGKSREQIVASVTMPEYASWGAYKQWLRLNVEGMIRLLSK